MLWMSQKTQAIRMANWELSRFHEGIFMDEAKPTTGTARRGFAALSIEQRKRIASMGGKAAHEKGTAHQFTTEEAVAAGKKRGLTAKKKLEIGTKEAVAQSQN